MMAAETKIEKKSSSVWSLFSSVKLTIALLIVLAVASIVGTLVPQREEAVGFARNLSPAMLEFFRSLNLFDMYHAFWFRLLIGLLALNLLVCSIDRFPHTWKRFRARPSPDRKKPFEGLPESQTALVQGNLEDAAQRVSRLLGNRYKRLQTKEDKDGRYFSADKGRYAYFGVYVVHLSVLIIIIGALIGSFFGFEGYANILEGDAVSSVALRKGGAPMDLGFTVRCDDFSVEFYKNGAPKEYRSDVTFLVDGKEAEKAKLLVNHPATFRGVTFYQASYGKAPGEKVSLDITRTASKPQVTKMDVKKGEWAPLPGEEGKFQVSEVDSNLMGVMGPAAMISIQPKQGQETRFWIFQDREKLEKRFPGMMTQNPKLNASAFKPYTFSLSNLESKYYTGLQVNRDPGVSVVWLGCFLMVAGFFVAFFTSHRRIWVRLAEEKGALRLSVAGVASKNPVGLERELERLTSDLAHLSGEGEK